jgi:hypothetical protein
MEKTDLAAFLSEIVAGNTKHYAEDLQYDIQCLFHAAKKPNMEDKSFYWMSRPNGTWCVKERNVFLQGSSEHSIWMYYGYEAEKIRAYRIVVTGISHDGAAVCGKVYPLDYAGQLARIQQSAMSIEAVELHFADGHTETVPFSEWSPKAYQDPAPEHIRFLPKSEAELTAAILLEHRCQTDKGKKAPTKLPKTRTR